MPGGFDESEQPEALPSQANTSLRLPPYLKLIK